MAEVMQAASQFTPWPQGGAPAAHGLEWRRSHGLVDYERAIAAMEARARALGDGHGSELVWLLQHPPLLTAGTSADAADLLDPGPGQRVAYAVLDLKRRRQDLRWYVHTLEEWLIRTLADFDIRGERRDGRIGIWVAMPDGSERDRKSVV